MKSKHYLQQGMEFDSNLQELNNVNLNFDRAQSISNLFRVSNTPIYAVDNVVRRASSLQNTDIRTTTLYCDV